MHAVLQNVLVAGIISSGQVYIFTEKIKRDLRSDELDIMYAITKDDEILPALEMELCIYRSSSYDLIKFLKWVKIDEDTYAFITLCYSKFDEYEIEFSLYLQRIWNFQEKSIDVHKRFLQISTTVPIL